MRSTSSRESVFSAKVQNRVERWMRAGARRVQLHRDAGIENLPAPAEIQNLAIEILALAVERVQVALRPSIAFSLAVMPPFARSAAITPSRAASPACSGFTIVPKFSFKPEADEAAMASA
jgi:hypothetical protein